MKNNSNENEIIKTLNTLENLKNLNTFPILDGIAFFPVKAKNPNECLFQLGEGNYIKTSVQKAVKILKSRIIKEDQAYVRQLEDGTIEITEQFNEKFEKSKKLQKQRKMNENYKKNENKLNEILNKIKNSN